MFTGIIQARGEVVSITPADSTARIAVRAQGLGEAFQLGESIAVNGVCLTVAAFADDVWEADIMRITLSATTLGSLRAGDQVNLERAVRPDSRLGGHIVQGHVDGTAVLVSRDSQAEWDDFTFSVDESLARYIASKGSVALNGTSLTVASVHGNTFSVSLIPTTLADTTLGLLTVGDRVNVEVDIVAKYVERLLGERA